MKPQLNLPRWRDQSQAPRGAAPEQSAVDLFSALKPVPRDPRMVTRLLNDLVAQEKRGEVGAPRLSFVFRVAIAALLLGTFGGALAAVHSGAWRRMRELMRERTQPAASAVHPVSRGPSSSQAPVPAPAIAAPPADPEPILEAPLRVASHSHDVRALPPAPSVALPAVVSAAAPTREDENSMIDKALAAVRAQRPQEALSALEAYRQRFPNGELQYDADLAEIKAQGALGKDGPELAVLDRAIALQGFKVLPRSPELSVLRGELLARTGNCKDAAPSFSQLLSDDQLESGLQERALFGRAVCLVKLGQSADGRRALRDYLNRFPAGRFVGAAQDALDPLE